MILKFEDADHDKDLYLFEATANHGVALKKWTDIREFIG